MLTPYGHGLISLIKSTPHPNTARVFTTWLISREGRITSQEVTANTRDARNSARIDIPNDPILPELRLREGVSYFGEGSGLSPGEK